jgi:hypothetical protein
MGYFWEFIGWLLFTFSIALFIPHWIESGNYIMVIVDSILCCGDLVAAICAYRNWRQWRKTNGKK